MSAVPAISVIIPAYNSAAYVREALDSVAAQTVPDIETIVVDDGSTDGTPEAVRAAASASVNPRIVKLPDNRGPAAARNAGVEASRAPWLAFLDADDAWFPWRLAVGLEAAAARLDAALLCGEAVDMGLASRPAAPERSPAIARCGLEDFALRNPVATSTVLLRRTAWDAAGGFDPRFRGPEDYDLWMRIAAAAPVYRIRWPVARYRSVPGSLSRSDATFLAQALAVLDKAYGPGGVLRGLGSRRQAEAYQYLCCAWMAAERRAWPRVARLFTASLLRWPGSFPARAGLRGCRLKLAAGVLKLAVHKEGGA